jgi:xanthine dehydrogenase accessory factor
MGAGHVGRALAHFVALCDFSVVVVDDRAEFADPERIPDADEVAAVTGFDGVFHDRIIDADSYIVIVTRGHSYDKFVLAQALKTEAGYIGMIGSRRKIALIYQSLLTEGFNRTDLERVHAPIGLAIGGETPEEIAVSITAQLISSRSKRTHLQKL